MVTYDPPSTLAVRPFQKCVGRLLCSPVQNNPEFFDIQVDSGYAILGVIHCSEMGCTSLDSQAGFWKWPPALTIKCLPHSQEFTTAVDILGHVY